MNASPKWMKIAGWVCHGLVAAVMIPACGIKASGMAPAQMVEEMTKVGLIDNLRLIGIGGLISVILMLVPRTSFLGSLAVSAYWGGAICLHMAHHESYGLQAALVLLTWAGACLRHPSAFLNRA